VIRKRLNTSLRIKFTILFVTVILIVFMMPRGGALESDAIVGNVWMQDDLIADFSYPVLKNSMKYKQEVEDEKKSILPVYVYNEDALRHSLDSVNSYLDNLPAMLQHITPNSSAEENNPTFLSAKAFFQLKDMYLKNSGKSFVSDALVLLRKDAGEKIKDFYTKGILGDAPGDYQGGNITIRKKNVDISESSANFFKLTDVIESVSRNAHSATYDGRESLVDEFAVHFLHPNICYDQALTKEELDYSIKKVSKYAGIVTENEKIIGKHDRINPENKLKIDSYRIAKGDSLGWEGYTLQFIGRFLHIFLLVVLFSIYLFLFRKRIYNENKKLLIFAIILLWTGFITYLQNSFEGSDAVRFLIFIPAASMLITIMFDSRVGFYATVVFSLICGALHGNDYAFVVMNVVAGALSAYSVRDIKNRNQIFRSFLFILIAYIIAVLAFGMESMTPWKKMFIEMAFASTNALVSPVLTYGLLVFFERIFTVTTDLTFIELCNFDRPLLRELAKKAPGSFNHSMTLGTLAESAATSINANPLLARAGAYYHDVGKLTSPKYFVENQLDSTNVHDGMIPEESVKAIKEHVFKGKALAKEYKLPNEIIDFIPMHHGTTVMNFFYEKAKRLYGEDQIDIRNYRYPGPKPNTKETAIVMLADSCESAVRSIKNPDADKVENVINNLFNARIEDGQLDESPLTLGDIITIKETFHEILLGQYHKRIQYPHQDELEKAD
jgi:cyclic-di-AMP phosphodiesterase PgpH